MQIQSNVSLKEYNTFGIDCKALYLIELCKEHEFIELRESDIFKNHTHLILGGGSNILLTQDFNGLVIINSIKGIELLSESESDVLIKAFAGEVWNDFVLYSIAKGFAGLENLTLIPGKVGAAPMQNIGAYGVEVKDVIDSVECINIETGEKEIISNADCKFGYRESIFKNSAKNKYFITAVIFKLKKQANFHTQYGAISSELEKMGVKDLTIKAVSDAVTNIRKSKLPNPKITGNAGSFFKNPVVSKSVLDNIKSNYPDVVSYPSGNDFKLAAGWLIEKAGWKGHKDATCAVNALQALVLVNLGGTTGKEVFSLAKKIQDDIKQKFGVELEMEVNIL